MRVTIEHDNGKPRLQRSKLSALEAAPSPARSGARRQRERPFRRSVDALLATLIRASANGDGEARELARRALSVYRGALRELGLQPSPSVSAHLLAFAQQHVAAQRIGVLAAESGLGSDRGLALLGEAQRAQGRAERSWIAAVAAGGMVRGRAPDPGAAPAPGPAEVAFERMLAEQEGREP